MSQYNIIISTAETTVVSEYEPQEKRSDAYQSEAALEAAFIKMLGEQGYEYVSIHSEEDLVLNLRKQIERLNQYSFTDKEWETFFKSKIANANEGIVEKTRKIQEDYVQNLTCEDGRTQNIYLIDKKNIHNNRLQVINQYEEDAGNHDTRYDVTILVNGFPLVHVELKRRGVAIKEAFNQINRYQRDSFWAGSGLYEYVQIFVISNGTFTKYYSNTTRASHIKENDSSSKKHSKKTSNFIVLFGNILRLRNILSAFDRFAGNEILSPIDFQDYTGTYHDVYDEIKPKLGSKDSIMDDVVFEMELVKQVEVNIDYILMLVAKYHDGNCEDKEILVAIDKAIKSSLQLRSKKELIENFIATINTKTDVNTDWQRFVKEQRERAIQALIAEEKLKPEETRKFVENAFRDGVLKTTGTDVDRLMPPVSRFGGGGSRDKKKQTVIEKLKAFFEKYFGLVNAGESFAEGSNK